MDISNPKGAYMTAETQAISDERHRALGHRCACIGPTYIMKR